MEKQGGLAYYSPISTNQECFRCKKELDSKKKLCIRCENFLASMYAPDAPTIDKELVKILNTPRSSRLELGVKKLVT